MRMKRALTAVLCAMLLMALLPSTALAVQYVQLAGRVLTLSTPYLKNGNTYTQNTDGWTAHFTGDSLHLRNLGQSGFTDQGLNIPADTEPFSMQLEGNANAFCCHNRVCHSRR